LPLLQLVVMARDPKAPSGIDAIDVFFGLIPAGSAALAVILWARLMVRALRGEKAAPTWGVSVASGLAIAAQAFVSGTRVREDLALRSSVVEVRTLVRDAAEEQVERDRRDSAREGRLYKLTVAMAVLAGLTLAAAIATLIVAAAS
jgi:hypothetical protein